MTQNPFPESAGRDPLPEPAPGVLYVVSTPIGNLEDISFRALKILRGVDLIAAEDTRTTGNLLRHFAIATPCISHHARNEAQRIPRILAALGAGQSVAVVSEAGTPCLSDPASLLVARAVEAGVRVVPIPGASAMLAALAACGFHTDKFVFEGFLPIKKRRSTRIRELAEEPRTIILYESPHRIARTLRDLLEAFGARRALLGRELTKRFEEFVRGSLAELAAHVDTHPVRGEYVIVLEGKGKSSGGGEDL